MKKACQALTNWNWKNPPQPLATMIPGGPNTAVFTLASAFVELQQARHEADYDLARRFSGSDVLALLVLADEAFAALNSMPKPEPHRRVFLLALVFQGRWKR